MNKARYIPEANRLILEGPKGEPFANIEFYNSMVHLPRILGQWLKMYGVDEGKPAELHLDEHRLVLYGPTGELFASVKVNSPHTTRILNLWLKRYVEFNPDNPYDEIPGEEHDA